MIFMDLSLLIIVSVAILIFNQAVSAQNTVRFAVKKDRPITSFQSSNDVQWAITVADMLRDRLASSSEKGSKQVPFDEVHQQSSQSVTEKLIYTDWDMNSSLEDASKVQEAIQMLRLHQHATMPSMWTVSELPVEEEKLVFDDDTDSWIKRDQIPDKEAPVEPFVALRQLHDASHANSTAAYLLGNLCFWGDMHWLPQNWTLAHHYYSLAAKQGHAGSQFMLGFMANTGLGTNRDVKRAFLYFTFAAHGGDVWGTLATAHMLTHGLHTSKSCEQSLYYYEKLASQVMQDVDRYRAGHPVQVRLLDKDDPILARQHQEQVAYHLSMIGGDDADAGSAYFALARLYYEGVAGIPRDRRRALLNVKKAAKLGVAGAMSMLARFYLHGDAGVTVDENLAYNYYRKAARLKHPGGYYGMGLFSRYGLAGVTQDISQAMDYFTRAAELGHIEALFELGQLYVDKGQPQKAVQYLFLSAKQENLAAQFLLGRLYQQGHGVQSSCDHARMYYKSVAEKHRSVQRLLRMAQQRLRRGMGRSVSEMPQLVDPFVAWRDKSLTGLEMRNLGLVMLLICAEVGLELAENDAAFVLATSHDPKQWSRAQHYWERASHQGSVSLIGSTRHNEARLQLGHFHWYSHPQKSLSFYQAADTEAFAAASFYLGVMHAFGWGVPRDFYLSKRYYDKAYAQNGLAVGLALMLLRVQRWIHAIISLPSSLSHWLWVDEDVDQKEEPLLSYDRQLQEEEENVSIMDLLRTVFSLLVTLWVAVRLVRGAAANNNDGLLN